MKLMTNESIHWREKLKRAEAIFKIDLEKVNDHVERGFVDYISK